MTSEIRTNTLASRAGLSTVTLTDSGPMFSGITTFVDNSGFNLGTGSSIFTPASNTLTFGTNNTEKVRVNTNGITVTGRIDPAADNTHDLGTNSVRFRSVYAHTLYGNGANLTSLPSQITFNNASADRILTSNGGTAVNAEANLTYNGNNLQFNTTANGHAVILKSTGNYYNKLSFDSNVSSAGDSLAFVDFSWDGDKVADILAVAGSDTTNKDDGHLVFRTSPSQGSISERLRITSAGKFGINYAGTPPSEDVMICTSGQASGAGLSLSHLSGGNRYGVRLQSITGTNQGLTISRLFNSSYTEIFKLDSTGQISSSANTNGQIIHSFRNTNTTAGSSAMTVEHWFRFNRSGGGMDSPAAKIIAGKEREWIGGASNQDGYLAFHTLFNESSTEKMRLTSNGALLINSTSQGSDELFKIFTSSTGPEMIQLRNNSGGTKDMITMMSVNNSGVVMIRFKQTGGLSNVGSITTSSNSTSYNTSSDYRIKENVTSITDGITRLKTLKPYRFNFKTDPTKTVDGFFAHEVTAVPEAVHGEKDAVETTYYAEGDTIPEGKSIGDIKEENIVLPQSLDYAKITPLLTAALQEAISKIETLEQENIALRARVTNLEGE